MNSFSNYILGQLYALISLFYFKGNLHNSCCSLLHCYGSIMTGYMSLKIDILGLILNLGPHPHNARVNVEFH